MTQTYVKIFRKTNISYYLICKRLCAYQGVRNASFSKNFAYVLNEWSLYINDKIFHPELEDAAYY